MFLRSIILLFFLRLLEPVATKNVPCGLGIRKARKLQKYYKTNVSLITNKLSRVENSIGIGQRFFMNCYRFLEANGNQVAIKIIWKCVQEKKTFQNLAKIKARRLLEASLACFWALVGAARVPPGCISRSGWASWPAWGPLGGVLGAFWERLGGVLGCLGAFLGASLAILGRLWGLWGLIFYQNGTKLRHAILNGIVHSISNRFLIVFGASVTSKIINIYYENSTFWLLGNFNIRSLLNAI